MSERLEDIAIRMVAEGKGILAADESTGTIKKRFDTIGAGITEDNRRDYREMLFSRRRGDEELRLRRHPLRRDDPPEGEERHAAASSSSRRPAPCPASRSMPAPSRLPASPGESVTEGLDGLRERLKEYHGLGARFAKWRAVITIGDDGRPSWNCIHANAHALARYAALCQEADDRADRRAGSADGRARRQARHRPLLRRDGVDAQHGLPRAVRRGRRRSKAWC